MEGVAGIKIETSSQTSGGEKRMPKASKATASQVLQAEGFEGHYQEVGSYTAAFESYTAHADLTPLFKGLPNDRCQCPHWGVVLRGKLVYHYADGDDVITAGEAYYAAPGHTPEIFPGTEVVEFSPTVDLRKTLEVVMKNAAEMGG
jgi:hypothetical protein